MGYYSEVKLILTDKGMDMLRAKIKKPTEDEPDCLAEPIYEATRLKDKYWLVEWYSVKWYDDWVGYKVPCAVSSLCNKLAEMDEPYQFMRVGEDYGDVEYDGCYNAHGMPWLELRREIEVEY